MQKEEKPSKHGTEIRFRVKDLNIPIIHHAEPAKVISQVNNSIQEEQSIPPVTFEQIRQITGKEVKSLYEIGQYLQVKYKSYLKIDNN